MFPTVTRAYISDADNEYQERLEPPSSAEAGPEGYQRRKASREPSDKDLLEILKRLTRKVERGEELSEGEIIEPVENQSRQKPIR